MNREKAVKASIKRWEKILADYPDVGINRGGQPDVGIYGDCELCGKYQECKDCPLYPEYCYENRHSIDNLPIYWQICNKLGDKKPCKRLIKKMLNKLKSLAENDDSICPNCGTAYYAEGCNCTPYIKSLEAEK